MGGGNVSNHNSDIKKDGQLITTGYISLQSESHPIDFKSVEIFDLSQYKDDTEKLKEVLELLKSEK
jgi:hypothetical protein